MRNSLPEKTSWKKTLAILGGLLGLALILPDEPVDPWGILDPQKVMLVIFALAFLQTVASVVVERVGLRAGAVLLGFLAGLVSSTATTATVAKQSRDSKEQDTAAEIAVLLSATLAMLAEAAFVLTLLLRPREPLLYLMFLAPILTCLALTFFAARRVRHIPDHFQNQGLEVGSLLKLAAFIVGILALSKILQDSLGDAGLMFLTFGVSLFEIHGSVIANIQLANAKVIGHSTLVTLFALSVAASFVSKTGLVYVLGSRALKVRMTWVTLILVTVQAVSWAIVKGLLAAG